ncbi:MAG: pilus assembly protein [Actinomycetota bacterium]|nr:pilus assembly protein [Actinomycetota bacterium]
MDERGQTTVEFALCLPFVALLLGAVVQVGLVVADHGRLWHAAREAARVATVDPDLGAIESAARNAGLSPVHVEVEPDALHRRQGDPVTVDLTYRPHGRVPLIGEMFQRLELRAVATMRIEQP